MFGGLGHQQTGQSNPTGYQPSGFGMGMAPTGDKYSVFDAPKAGYQQRGYGFGGQQNMMGGGSNFPGGANMGMGGANHPMMNSNDKYSALNAMPGQGHFGMGNGFNMGMGANFSSMNAMNMNLQR